MTGYAQAISGGTADAVTYPLEETHPIDNTDEVEEALAYATEALAAADNLTEMDTESAVEDPISVKLVNVALERYIGKFSIPTAALESNDLVVVPGGDRKAAEENVKADAPKAGRLKKVILYLYALVQRVFNAIFDYFRNQKLVARKLMPKTKEYIGRADSFSSSVGEQMNIKDRSLMIALQIDGVVPKKVPELYDALLEVFVQQHQYSSVTELIQLIAAVKEKNPERIQKEAQKLRDQLEEGLKANMEEVDPSTSPAFSETKANGNRYYASEPTFGQNYIYGISGDAVTEAGAFVYRCGIRRDAEVPLRVAAFPVLPPDHIRHICRVSLRICESIIRFSRDEDLLQKALREASFLVTKEPDKSVVAALKNIAAVGQNSYIVHLRFTTRTMQALMRWCAISIKMYEDVGKKNG